MKTSLFEWTRVSKFSKLILIQFLLLLFFTFSVQMVYAQKATEEKRALLENKNMPDKEEPSQKKAKDAKIKLAKADKPSKKEVLGQNSTDERCGFTIVEQMIKEKFPNRPNTEQFERWMNEKIREVQRQGQKRAVVEIPVVVHVIHNGEAVGGLPNISDAQVQSQIDVLNEDFQRLNADAANTPSDFTGVASNLEITFCLAAVGPDGSATNGINRYNGGQDSYSITDLELSIKPATIWNPDYYFNIWSAPLQGGLLGYAQFPSASGLDGMPADGGPAATDGIVVRDLAFGVGGSAQAPFNLGRTCTHEAGHFFGLRHIGGDGDCSADDFCADTPTQNGQNNNTEDDCSYPADDDCDDGPGDLPDQFMNYMDYSDDACMNLFTADQKARADVVLALSPRRASLINSFVCNADLVGTPPPPFDPFPNAPDNDLCGGAFEIGCGDSAMGNTSDASALDLPDFCGTAPEAFGVWYKFVGDGNKITASLCGSDYDTKINVYSGSCESLSCIAGNDDFCSTQSQVTFIASIGTDYYIYVNGWSGSTGNFTLNITCEDPGELPENDLCSDAVVVTCGETVTGTTTNSSLTGTPTGTCGTLINTEGVWYSIVGDGSLITASLCDGTDYDSKIAVFTGVCGDLTCVDGDDDGCGSFGGPSEVSWISSVGATYYIYVTGYSGATGDFTLTISCEEAPDPPANDFCEDAIAISCGDIVEGTTIGATGTGDLIGNTCVSFISTPGVWYTIVAEDEAMILSLCSGTDYDSKLFMFTGECGDLSCYFGNDDGCGIFGGPSEIGVFTTPGETYHIFVSGFNGETGDFTLSATCFGVPENDLCEDAINLDCTTSIAGNNILATNDQGLEVDCSDDIFSDDVGQGVWYTITGTGSNILLSTCNTADFDTKIDVYTGECGDLTCYAGNEDGPGCDIFTSELEFYGEEGVTYYVYISGFTIYGLGTSLGFFDLNISYSACESVYIGYEYANECTTLNPLADNTSGGSYNWSTGETTESITVCPTETTEYSVTVTDSEGCTNISNYTVEAYDVSCGNQGNKVMVCHNDGKNPRTLCISEEDVVDHLEHGDFLGSCDIISCDPFTAEDLAESMEAYATTRSNPGISDNDWTISPNPTSNILYVSFEGFSLDQTSIRMNILDPAGKVVMSRTFKDLSTSEIRVDLSTVPSGMYYIQVISDQIIGSKKLFVVR